MDQDLDIRISLEEMKSLFKEQIHSIETIKANARTIFSSASLIIGIVSASQLIERIPTLQHNLVFLIGGALAIALYVLLIAICLKIILPMDIWGPVNPSRENLAISFANKNERDILDQLLSNYLNIINHNFPEISRRARLAKCSGIILCGIMVDLLFLCIYFGV